MPRWPHTHSIVKIIVRVPLPFYSTKYSFIGLGFSPSPAQDTGEIEKRKILPGIHVVPQLASAGSMGYPDAEAAWVGMEGKPPSQRMLGREYCSVPWVPEPVQPS